MKKDIIGTYLKEEEAVGAIKALVEKGYHPSDISIVAKDDEMVDHVEGTERRCRCCPGSVQPGWHLCLMLSRSEHTAPGAVVAPWTGVACFPNPGALLPVVRLPLRLGGACGG